MSHPMITTTDVLMFATDEWAAEHYPARTTAAEVDETAARLARLHQLVGHQAAEVMAFLIVLMHRRDGASLALLRWLRSLDEQARA